MQDSTLVGAVIPTQNADKTGTRPMGSDFGEMSIVDFLSSQVGNLDQNGPRLFGLYPNGLFIFGHWTIWTTQDVWTNVIWTILNYKDMRAIAIWTNMNIGL